MDRQFKFVQHLGPRFVTCEVKYSWFGCWCFSFVFCAFFIFSRFVHSKWEPIFLERHWKWPIFEGTCIPRLAVFWVFGVFFLTAVSLILISEDHRALNFFVFFLEMVGCRSTKKHWVGIRKPTINNTPPTNLDRLFRRKKIPARKRWLDFMVAWIMDSWMSRWG